MQLIYSDLGLVLSHDGRGAGEDGDEGEDRRRLKAIEL